MKDQYNPGEKDTYLQYLDANNLYGWAMIQKLPTHGFGWENVDGFDREKIDELVKTDKKSFILEVDEEYPEEMHKDKNKLPFKYGHPFLEGLLAIKMGKTEIKMNQPVDLAQAILDLSKTLMYKFCYDYMQPKYGNKVKSCYMDTKSFLYEPEAEDFYKDIE